MKNLFHPNILTFALVTSVHDADVHVLVHTLGCLLEGQVDMVLLGTKVKIFCTSTTTLAKVAKIATKDISEQLLWVNVAPEAPLPSSSHTKLFTSAAVSIILSPLVIITKDLISFRNVLELF
jgi:hypothetical protein